MVWTHEEERELMHPLKDRRMQKKWKVNDFCGERRIDWCEQGRCRRQ